MTDILLTDKQILKIAGDKSKILIYPDIKNYNSIEELFGNNNKIILLYLNEVTDSSYSGHWTCLIRRKEGKDTVVEFMDPYGLVPNDELKWFSENELRNLNQDNNHLIQLLYNFSLQKNHKVEYNEDKVQAQKNDIATCGRFVALRCHFYDVPLKIWQEQWKNLKKKGYDLDQVSVYMTNILNGSPIQQE
jgi:hypothetical protein